nr:hypothetical protein [Tanacetum cinerariifolium]
MACPMCHTSEGCKESCSWKFVFLDNDPDNDLRLDSFKNLLEWLLPKGGVSELRLEVNRLLHDNVDWVQSGNLVVHVLQKRSPEVLTIVRGDGGWNPLVVVVGGGSPPNMMVDGDLGSGGVGDAVVIGGDRGVLVIDGGGRPHDIVGDMVDRGRSGHLDNAPPAYVFRIKFFNMDPLFSNVCDLC